VVRRALNGSFSKSKWRFRLLPNGGPDNCATCGFNHSNEGRWGAHSKPPGFCTIRHTEIPVPQRTIARIGTPDRYRRKARSTVLCMTGEPGAYRGLAPSRQKLECKQLAWCVARNRIKDGFDYSRRFVRVLQTRALSGLA
jgi:hypothetical protein